MKKLPRIHKQTLESMLDTYRKLKEITKDRGWFKKDVLIPYINLMEKKGYDVDQYQIYKYKK